MSSIDERIVEMQFKNSQFEGGVKDTISTLERLEQALHINTSGLQNSVDGIAQNIETVKSRFGVFGAVGFTALQSLTNAAIGAGKSMGAALINPIVEGGKKRALNIAQARFQFQGLGMDIEATMANALDAVKGTAFGLDEAAVAAANFGATGMRAGDEMAAALKGISGVAAMAGASYSDIANVFGKVAGQGRLMGDDLNRLAARGINAAATLAKQMGKSEGAVRDMVSKGQISFKQFASSMNEAFGEQATKANDLYTGALSNTRAALARIGADFASSKFEAQRKILVSIIPVIDKFNEGLFRLKHRYNIVTQATADAISSLLAYDSKAETFANKGVQNLVDSFRHFSQAIEHTYLAIKRVVGPIGKAFAEVFFSGEAPFLKIGKALQKFTYYLIISEEVGDKIRRVFAGFFTVFKIGFDILGSGIRIVASFFGALLGKGDGVKSLSGSILDFLAGVGDAIVRFREWIHEGDRFNKFVSTIQSGIRTAVETVKEFVRRLGDVWSAIRAGDWGAFKDGMASAMSVFDPFREKLMGLGALAMSALGDAAKSVGDWFNGFDLGFFDFIGEKFEDVSDRLSDATEKIDGVKPKIDTSGLKNLKFKMPKIEFDSNAVKNAISDLWNQLKTAWDQGSSESKSWLNKGFEFIENTFIGIIDFLKTRGTGELLAIINTIFFVILNRRFKEALDVIREVPASLSGMFNAIGSPFAQFSENLKQAAKGNYFLKVAAAIAILAGSLWLLAKIPANDLLKAGGAMLALFIAIGLMVKLIEKSNINETNTGMLQVAGMLIGVGIAMALFAKAASTFGSMNIEELLKGVGAITAILLVLTAFTRWGDMSSMTIKGAIAIGLLAVSLQAVAWAIERFSLFSWEAVGEGILIMAAALGALSIALMLIPPGAVGKAAGILALAGSLFVVAEVIQTFADLEGESDAVWTVIGLLGALTAAIYALSGALKGGAALALGAAAIWLIGDAISNLAAVDPEAQGEALKSFAWALGLIAIFGAIATPFTPGLWAIAGVIAAVGVAALGFGVGAGVFAWGISQIIQSLGALGEKPQELAEAMDILSEAAKKNADAIGALVGVGAGLFVLAFGLGAAGVAATVMGLGLMAAGIGLALIIRYAEPGAEAIREFVDSFSFFKDLPKIAAMGAAFSALGVGLGLLGAGAVLTAIGMLAMAAGLGAFLLVASFGIIVMNLLTPTIAKLATQMDNLAKIGDTMQRTGYQANTASIQFGQFYNSVRLFGNVFSTAKGQIDAFKLSLSELSMAMGQTILGMIVSISLMPAAFEGPFQTTKNTVETQVKAIADALKTFSTRVGEELRAAEESAKSGGDKVVAAIRAMESRINSTLRGMVGSVRSSAASVGTAIGSGMVSGINSSSSRVAQAAASMASRAVASARANLVISSPSKVFEKIGEFVGMGFAIGITGSSKLSADSTANMARLAIQTASDILGIASPSKEFIKLGKYVNEGFAKGIRGSNDQVEGAFEQMAGNLERLRDKAKGEVDDFQETVDKVTAQHKKNLASLQKAEANLRRRNTAANRKEVDRLRTAVAKSTASLKDWTNKLNQAKKEYNGTNAALGELIKRETAYIQQMEKLNTVREPLLESLAEETKKLEDAQRAYDDYNKSVKDSYDNVPQITGEDSNVETFLAELESQILKTSAFTDVLDRLVDLGINDELYRELVSKGTDAMPFALSLLEGGIDAVNAVNELGGKLISVSDRIAKNTSDRLYLAGVQSAEGIVKGLQDSVDKVEAQINTLADSMINALKNKLGIKSPSRVFASLGKDTVEGFVEGLSGYNRAIEKSAESMGSDAVDAFRKSISGLSRLIDSDVELNPTITPILDLSNIERTARRIPSLMGHQVLGTESGYNSAMQAALGRKASVNSIREAVKTNPPAGPTLNYTQVNNSPKPLSNVEIYRQTKNQLSTVKEALDI